MTGNLSQLISTYAQAGKLNWISLGPARRATVVMVESAEVLEDGLQGDHGASDKRAVTLFQSEHLPVIAAFLGRDIVPPELLRRNLMVSGINLSALKGREVAIGKAIVEITGVCAPCSRMEEALGHGGYSAMRGHGGWCARVLQPVFRKPSAWVVLDAGVGLLMLVLAVLLILA